MSDDEVIDDATEIVGDEDFVNGKFKKCGKCNRLIIQDIGERRGARMVPGEGEELKEYIINLRKQLREEQDERERDLNASNVATRSKSTPGVPNNIQVEPGTSTGQPPAPNQTSAQTSMDPNIDMKAFFQGMMSVMQQQTVNIQQVMNMQSANNVNNAAAANAAARVVAEANLQAAGRPPPNQQMWRPPTKVPKFSKKMNVELFLKTLKVWNNSHSFLEESLRMTMILDSMKENTEREDLQNWVIFNIYEDKDFKLEEAGVMVKFEERLKEKFDISPWEKSENVWKDLLNFKAKEDEKTKEYIESFNEIESKMRNVGNIIPDMFLAIHLVEKAMIPEHSRQSVLSNIKLEDKKTVLKEVKKKMENILPKVGGGEASMTLWNDRRRGYEGPEDKRGIFYRGEGYPGQNWRERGESRGSKSREREERDRMMEAEEESRRSRQRSKPRYEERGRSRGRSGRSKSQGRAGRSRSKGRREVYYSIESVVDQTEVFYTNVENKAILDSGCPKTVGGQFWFDMYKQSLKQIEEFKNLYIE